MIDVVYLSCCFKNNHRTTNPTTIKTIDLKLSEYNIDNLSAFTASNNPSYSE